MQLPAPKKEKLYVHIRSVLGMLQWNTVPQLISLVMVNPTMQLQVELKTIGFFSEVQGADLHFMGQTTQR